MRANIANQTRASTSTLLYIEGVVQHTPEKRQPIAETRNLQRPKDNILPLNQLIGCSHLEVSNPETKTAQPFSGAAPSSAIN
jgi:hypothetical protein